MIINGEEIRRQREAMGLTLGELAYTAGVSIPTISHIERGNKTTVVEVLVRIADRFGVTVDSLLKPRA